MEKPQVLEVMQRKYVLDFATLQNLGKNVILEQLCPFLFCLLYGIILLRTDERVNICKSAKHIGLGCQRVICKNCAKGKLLRIILLIL